MQFGSYLSSFVAKEFLLSNSIGLGSSFSTTAVDYDSLRMLPQGHKPHVASSSLCPISTTLQSASLCRIDTSSEGGGHSTRPGFSAFPNFSGGKTWGPKDVRQALPAFPASNRGPGSVPNYSSQCVEHPLCQLECRDADGGHLEVSFLMSLASVTPFLKPLRISALLCTHLSPVACFNDCTALQNTSSLIAQDWGLQCSWINMIWREIAAPFRDHLKVSENILSRIPESAFN